MIVRKIAVNFREEQIITQNSHGEFSRKANYRSKIRTDWNNRHHTNAEQFPRNIVSSKISSKCQDFLKNLLALLLHNTVHHNMENERNNRLSKTSMLCFTETVYWLFKM